MEVDDSPQAKAITSGATYSRWRENFIATQPSVSCAYGDITTSGMHVRKMTRHGRTEKVTRPDGDIAGRVVWDRREDGREAGADLNLAISRRRRP